MLVASTSLLIAFNILFGIVFLFRRRRRPGEPPLLTCTVPFVGEALKFGASPYKFLKEAREKLGDVFTLKMAGWNYHFFMNPLDVVSLERCHHLDEGVVIGDFVTRMVGRKHSIHNNDSPSLFTRVLDNLITTGKSGSSTPANKTATTQENIRSSQEKNDVSHAIVQNLRGTTQLQELCRSCFAINFKCTKEIFDEVLHNGKDLQVGLYQICQDLIFDFTFNILFGWLPNEEERIAETKAFKNEFSIFNKHSALLVDRIPIHLLPETKKSRDRLLQMFGEMNFSRRINTSHMVSDVMKANPNKEKRIRHLLIILWSAQANTTPGLFWMLFYVLKDKTIQKEVLNEYEKMLDIKRKYSGVPHKTTQENSFSEFLQLEKADLDKLVVLDAVLKEVMRITGSNLSLRRAMEDTIVRTWDGKKYRIRKGDYTSHFAPFTHFDPEIFDQPENFIFDRFLERDDNDAASVEHTSTHATVKPRSKFFKKDRRVSASRAVMTFGFGATRCPGRHLAMIEIKVLTITLLKHFNLKLENYNVPGYDLKHIGFGIMPPDRDVKVDITRLSNPTIV